MGKTMDIRVRECEAVLIDKFAFATGDYEALLKDLPKLVPKNIIFPDKVRRKVYNEVWQATDAVYKHFRDVDKGFPKEGIFPLAKYSRKDKLITYWPNIIGKMAESYYIYEYCKQFFDKDVAENPRKWEHDPEKVMARTEQLTPARFFKKFGLADRILKDDQVRDIAEKFENLFGDTSMFLCKTVEDYTLQFKCNAPSCMRISGGYDTELWPKMEKKFGIWPSAWYHFNPYMQGVYLARKGGTEVVARSFLVRDTVTEEFKRFGGIYAISGAFNQVLREMLEDAGYKDADKIGAYRDVVSIRSLFEVPAYELDGKLYCPLPFSDDCKKGFGVYFDTEKKVFVFGPTAMLPKGNTAVLSMYAHHGYISAESVTIRK